VIFFAKKTSLAVYHAAILNFRRDEWTLKSIGRSFLRVGHYFYRIFFFGAFIMCPVLLPFFIHSASDLAIPHCGDPKRLNYRAELFFLKQKYKILTNSLVGVFIGGSEKRYRQPGLLGTVLKIVQNKRTIEVGGGISSMAELA